MLFVYKNILLCLFFHIKKISLYRKLRKGFWLEVLYRLTSVSLFGSIDILFSSTGVSIQ